LANLFVSTLERGFRDNSDQATIIVGICYKWT